MPMLFFSGAFLLNLFGAIDISHEQLFRLFLICSLLEVMSLLRRLEREAQAIRELVSPKPAPQPQGWGEGRPSAPPSISYPYAVKKKARWDIFGWQK